MKRKFSFLVVVAMLMTLFITPAHAVGPNLITNGDFENGKTDFTSEYTYLDPTVIGPYALYSEYMYTVGANPSFYHGSWASFGDLTSGSGKMMIVNGTFLNNETKTVWSQDVTLQSTSPTDIVTSYDLFAGKTWLVGKVEVKTTNTQVCVKLVLNQATIDEHYLMTEVHIEIEDTSTDIPQVNGNPVPGKFDVNVALNPGQTFYEACFNNTLPTGSTYYIAAHAKVERPEIGHEAPFCAVNYELCGTSYIVDHTARSESAWGGTNPFSGKNWAKYIMYTTTTPESSYRFTMFVRSTYPDAPAIIKVEVSGTEIGTAELTSDVNNWSKFEYDFQVPQGGSGTVKLTDFRLVASGDDFAIDDISLVRMP